MDDTLTRHIILPKRFFWDRLPLCYCSIECYARKTGTTLEGTIADARHAVGDCHACKSGAALEGKPTYCRQAVGDYYARKPGATREGRTGNARHASVHRNDTCITT